MVQPRSPWVSRTEQWIVPVTRGVSASRMKAATFSSGGGSQSSLGSRVSFQCSQICRASSVSRLTSGKPCARANRRRPGADQQAVAGPLHHQPGDGRRVHDVAERRHRAAAVGRPVHDGGVELDHAVFVGQSAQPTEWSLGSASTIATPSIAASSGSCPCLTSSIARSTARNPLALETAIGRRLPTGLVGAAPMASVLRLAAAVEAMK